MNKNEMMKGFNDYFILTILKTKDSYGYEISKRISELSGLYYTIKESTMYTALQRLEMLGYIQSYKGNLTHGKPRLYYHLTQGGIEYLKELEEEVHLLMRCIDKFKGLKN